MILMLVLTAIALAIGAVLWFARSKPARQSRRVHEGGGGGDMVDFGTGGASPGGRAGRADHEPGNDSGAGDGDGGGGDGGGGGGGD